MTRKVILARQARDDLEGIFEWLVDEASISVARQYTERLRDFLRRFDLFPERGTLRNDLFPGLRLIGFERRVTVGFLVTREEVVIARILYGGRNLDDLPWNDDSDATPGS